MRASMNSAGLRSNLNTITEERTLVRETLHLDPWSVSM